MMKKPLNLVSMSILFLAVTVLVFGFEKTVVSQDKDGGSTAGENETTTQDGSSVADPQDLSETPKSFTVEAAEGAIQFTVSGKWKKVNPSNNIIEVEIKIPKLESDQQDGRLTISGAGGSIEANLERWEGQFSTKSVDPKRETKKIAEQKVHLIDLVGTYVDAPGGPFSGAPTIERENYRMLGAIIETSAKGNYFVKFYGPKEVLDKNEKEFKMMIESLKVKN